VIRVRVPLRIPFAGGLSDVKPYAERFGGITVSCTIGLGAEVALTESESGLFEVSADGEQECAERLNDLGNDLAREALRSVDPAHRPVRLEVRLDVKGKSGLGASGAIAVALLHALRLARGEDPNAEDLADEAAKVEVDVLGGNSGYHDPHVCARGGLLRLDYSGADITARRIVPPSGFLSELESSLLIFATGTQASTKESLARLTERLDDALPVLHDIKALALVTEDALVRGDLTALARCIGAQQRLKQLLPGAFTDELVSAVTDRMKRCGASVQFPGGKVGAYMFVCCPAGQQDEVRRLLPEFAELPLRLTREGSRNVSR
jgi:D-glycero-alpha-D-manno-heptose-7-phosphate kinase